MHMEELRMLSQTSKPKHRIRKHTNRIGGICIVALLACSTIARSDAELPSGETSEEPADAEPQSSAEGEDTPAEPPAEEAEESQEEPSVDLSKIDEEW